MRQVDVEEEEEDDDDEMEASHGREEKTGISHTGIEGTLDSSDMTNGRSRAPAPRLGP